MKLVVARRRSGLGDMMCQLVHLMWFAERTVSQVAVDWRDGYYHAADDDRDLFRHLFDPADGVAVIGDVLGSAIDRPASFWPPCWSFDLVSSRKGGERFRDITSVEEFALTGYTPVADVLVTTRCIDFLPASVTDRYYRMLRPVPIVVREAEALLSGSPKTLGVHIRHGNGELYDETGTEQLLALYSEAIDRQLRELGDGCDVYLATDSELVEDWFRERWGAFLRPPGRVMSGKPGVPVHHRHATGDVDRFDVARDGLLDMWALGCCDHLVCDNWSSFTRASRAWLGDPSRVTILKAPRVSAVDRERSGATPPRPQG